MKPKELEERLNKTDDNGYKWRVTRQNRCYIITYKGYQKSIAIVKIPDYVRSPSPSVNFSQIGKPNIYQIVDIISFANTPQIEKEMIFDNPNDDPYLSSNGKELYNSLLISTTPQHRNSLTVNYKKLIDDRTINGNLISFGNDFELIEKAFIELCDRDYLLVKWLNYKSGNDFTVYLTKEN